MKKKLLIIAVIVILAVGLCIYFIQPLKLTEHFSEKEVRTKSWTP